MPTNQSCCIEGCKKEPKIMCLGCPELLYCVSHHKQHQDNLNIKLHELIDECNQFLNEIEIQTENSQKKHGLLKYIGEWETKSIAKIRQMAQENREALVSYVANFIPNVKIQMANFITKVSQNSDDSEVVDTDIEQWTEELERLKATLNNPSDSTVREDSTEFISKIYFKVEVISNIPANATWTQNGVTVAGGYGNGNATNQLNHPFSLFVDDDQTVVIADCANHRIIQWKKDDLTNGQIVAGGKGKGNGLHQLNEPTDVLIDKKTNSFIICDRWNQRVVRWSRRSGITQGEILIDNVSCFGLAMDDQRYIYVSDTKKHEVRRYELGEKNGTLVAGGNGEGADLNQLNEPRYLFVDRQQNVYVSDRNNHRVMKWIKGATEGIVVAGGQGQGDALTQLNSPNGLFVDTLGTLYVADSWNRRVMGWSQGAKRGAVIGNGNGKGTGSNQFYGPVCLTFDRHGNLYVVDHNNHRVQRFSIE
ncbi:unnamed protein product [Rotaria magnacalcarata]|uniref:Uncharacterized protein n=1 Tax=Rotaria magnacalcarata TaxID=392030 RepID=A0A816PW69_9BILA|nr:unnamed protein product [Rotaria magnacalcarata]CAF4132307.1 unnamed protein product [Rotaria magnacalcarata]